MLNILIGAACACIILKFLFDEHYRQENLKKMNRFTNLLDKLLPKAFPQLFQEEAEGNDALETPTVPTPEELFGNIDPATIAELEIRSHLRELTLKVLEGHSFQIDFLAAEAKAIQILLSLNAQANAELDSDLKALLPQTTIEAPEIPSA